MFNREYIIRIISGIAIVSLFVFAIQTLIIFSLLMVAVFFLMLREWYYITKANSFDILVGFVTISVAIASLLIVKMLSLSEFILLWYFAIIWTFDTMAMLGGKFIGGKKIAEKISPQKTWSGFLSGLYFSSLISTGFFYFYAPKELENYKIIEYSPIIASTIICVFAHVGDFFESYYKRKYNIKDSGAIIPGHGGVLDRFDSIIFSAPILLIITIFLL